MDRALGHACELAVFFREESHKLIPLLEGLGAENDGDVFLVVGHEANIQEKGGAK